MILFLENSLSNTIIWLRLNFDTFWSKMLICFKTNFEVASTFTVILFLFLFLFPVWHFFQTWNKGNISLKSNNMRHKDDKQKRQKAIYHKLLSTSLNKNTTSNCFISFKWKYRISRTATKAYYFTRTHFQVELGWTTCPTDKFSFSSCLARVSSSRAVSQSTIPSKQTNKNTDRQKDPNNAHASASH